MVYYSSSVAKGLKPEARETRKRYAHHRGIAQLVEQRSPKPRAEGSSPSAPAKKKQSPFGDCFFFVRQNLSSARARRASSPSAAGGRCSEARMAQRSKCGGVTPYFGHRKRGCEATSSSFVFHRQSCGDNHCFCFTSILLAFSI